MHHWPIAAKAHIEDEIDEAFWIVNVEDVSGARQYVVTAMVTLTLIKLVY